MNRGNPKWPQPRPAGDSGELSSQEQYSRNRRPPAPEETIKELRAMILRAFPPEPYYGTIVAGGDIGPGAPELDDQDLYLTLKNQRWTDTPVDFLARHLGDFVLLTAEACAAFLPAWLLFSLDNEYQGAEFVTHTFAPDDTTSPSGTGELQAGESQTSELKIRQLSIEMFRPLTASQRRIVRAFLEHIAQYHPSSFIADRAAAAAHTVDNLILVFESGHL